jgi:hypothetical protein
MQESVSNGNHQIDEHRAAALIGISPVELRSLARQARLGEQLDETWKFSYDDLRQLCLLMATSHL